MNDQKSDHTNTIIAVVLSGLVLLAWQYFVGLPQLERQKQNAPQQQQTQQAPAPPVAGQPGTASQPQQQSSALPLQPATAKGEIVSRDEALAKSARIPIDTPDIAGSIALTGARIDDVSLRNYHETVDRSSPAIVLLSPSASPYPYYAEFGWLGPRDLKLPDSDTVWKQEGTGALTPDRPVTLVWNNGEGLTFRRIISVDPQYLFTVRDEVANTGSRSVTLSPYALVSRHGTPPASGTYLMHEGFVGKLGDQCLRQGGFSFTLECHQERYTTVEQKKEITFDVTNAWLGFTDKYWAATLVPDTTAKIHARVSAGQIGEMKTYQADYQLDPQTIAPGGNATAYGRLFAGAKEVATIDAYDETLHLNRFELLIDWGWYYFITKPMFKLIDTIFHLVGNFGVAILIVTVLVKLAFFPLANKSYASMAKMKALQPQMQALRERYPDDKVKQQQAMMDIYKEQKINPVAGCLPILIQIPVFFSLYKVLFVTIEMRHAPFFGWIKDLSAPDPTTVFNLFGLIPWDPSTLPFFGHFLMIGAWPIIMGITMWAQMKLNPAPPDPTQKMMMDWMPLIFLFMLANFSAGLVIYWAWNNSLSALQQSVIMRKNGAKIELWDNLKSMFARRRKTV